MDFGYWKPETAKNPFVISAISVIFVMQIGRPYFLEYFRGSSRTNHQKTLGDLTVVVMGGEAGARCSPLIVTVIGKAFFDIEHASADQPNRRRNLQGYAAWEIHPVMKLDVKSD